MPFPSAVAFCFLLQPCRCSLPEAGLAVGGDERAVARGHRDFSARIPLLTGPGTITSVLLLMAQARGSLAKLAAVAGALALVFLLTRLVIGFGAEGLMRLLRPGGLHVVTRVLGICLQRWPCNSCSMELASSYGCSR